MLTDYVEMILIQGGTYEGAFTLSDELGNPLNTSWAGRVEIRTSHDGSLVTSFAASGADGTLTINGFGNVLLTLPSAVTAALEPTSDSLGLNRTHHIGDIEVWQIATPTNRYKPEAPFRVFIRPEVTTA